MSKLILSIDLGFGDNKVVLSKGEEIVNKFKFPSIVAVTQRNPLVRDERIYSFEGRDFYVGDDAYKMQTSSIIDINTYELLEFFAPLFVYHASMVLGGISPDIITSGLSKSHIQHSGHFEERLKKFTVDGQLITNSTIYILPQGAGGKITIDKYGSNFPELNKEFLGATSYVGCDVGFNTVDMFQVINGKTSPNLFEGIEQHGIMKIARKLADFIKVEHGRDLTLNETKVVLLTNKLTIRNTSIDLKEIVMKLKAEYLSELMQIIEEKYGKILDKMQYLYLMGGGSYLFRDNTDSFIKIPKNDNEYYNAIGFGLYGYNRTK